jgi:hypothetical protein
MDKIKKGLGYINIIVSTLILIIFSKELLIPKDGPISILEEKRNFAEKRTLLIEWKTASWSGVLFKSDNKSSKILTIIHEDSMKKIKESGDISLKISDREGKTHTASIKAWNNCNELALLEISSGYTDYTSPIHMENKQENLSQGLFSFGHPLGLNLHYSEGYLSSTGNKIKPCGMVTNGFSGGTVPGQTGSGVWNKNGELAGLIVATSAMPVKSYDSSGNQSGVSVIPVTFLGRFVPASEIKIFLKKLL